MKVKVTQECIDNGVPKDPRGCAVACAINNTIGLKYPLVGQDWMRFTMNGRTCKVPTPPQVIEFIDAFDDGLSVQPLEFELETEVTDGN